MAKFERTNVRVRSMGGEEMPYGKPRSDIERLKRHFGSSWRKHDISELPPRGYRKRG